MALGTPRGALCSTRGLFLRYLNMGPRPRAESPWAQRLPTYRGGLGAEPPQETYRFLVSPG